MALLLYRRHRRDCKANHSEDLRTSEFEERKKGFRRCECSIVCAGTLGKKFRRKATGQWEWDAARVFASRLEQGGSWNTAPPPPVADNTASKDAEVSGITIAEALEAYLAKCKNRGIQPTTLAKYRTFTNQFRDYCEGRGYVLIDQLTVSDMDRFYASWKDGIRGKAKKLDRLKGFVKFCLKRKWLSEDIAEDLEAPEGSSLTIPKAPFTDDELTRICAACDAIGGPTKQGPGYRTWTGEDAKDFILLSIYIRIRMGRKKRHTTYSVPESVARRIHLRLQDGDHMCGR